MLGSCSSDSGVESRLADTGIGRMLSGQKSCFTLGGKTFEKLHKKLKVVDMPIAAIFKTDFGMQGDVHSYSYYQGGRDWERDPLPYSFHGLPTIATH